MLNRLRRVWAIGRDTYIRLYPNPGIGVRVGDRRVAASWFGGLEVYSIRKRDDGHMWVRTYAALSRVKRPRGKV